MRAIEAKNQNDKVFVDAMFALNPNYQNSFADDVDSSIEVVEKKDEESIEITEESKNITYEFNKLNSSGTDSNNNKFSNLIEKYKNIETSKENYNINKVEHFDFGIIAEIIKAKKTNNSDSFNLKLKDK